MQDVYKPHLNTPPHWFVSNAVYVVTGATLYKKPLLNNDLKLENFCSTLQERANILEWSLEAWAVMPNHYHFIARSPDDVLSLKLLIQGVHSLTGKFINQIDGIPGRKVWHNYWDTCIRDESSYYSRLNYVILNPVKHGLVQNPEDYPFSSYKSFLENTEPEFREMVLSQSFDNSQIIDDF